MMEWLRTAPAVRSLPLGGAVGRPEIAVYSKPCYANGLNGQLAVSARVLGLGGGRSVSSTAMASTAMWADAAIERPGITFAAKKHLWRPKERPPQH